jgi:tetratricopeptide (TPR) repeat protein
MFNPFPGLRPFEADEDHLFFGREKEVDELLRRLRLSRFLSIVGTSGSGKSSLVRSGLIPSLYGGFMVNTNSNWRIAVMRPGEDPVKHLAAALNAPDVFGTTGELETTNSILFEATLQRGTRGLVEAVRQTRALSDDNLLIVVDQFEELFRFRKNPQLENSRDEAVAFVKLLLEAAQQEDLPIYLVITMRSDFIGDCMDFVGLPEAVNSGLYLVPRMTRDELRSAITGPVAVGGGSISQRLVLRLLNDFGDEYDQLPILQHALMRTWDYWAQKPSSSTPIDIEDYEAIGTFHQALSNHADEAYDELGTLDAKKIAERVFKALTDTFTETRGIRRPTSISDLTAITEASEADVVRTVEVFRRSGRSFLMPPADVPLEPRSIIDLSHESLMRCWVRLAGWAEQERISADIYSRLSDAAMWCKEGRAGLWRNPELEVGQKWRSENQPSPAWAGRYNYCFAEVMSFLDRSEAERLQLSAEKTRERQKKLRQTQWAAGILAGLLLVAIFLAYFAWRQTSRAEDNLQYAQEAVDQSLSVAGSEQAREASDVPGMEAFRKQLLDKAQTFYTNLSVRNSPDLTLRIEKAQAHSRLGDIDRLMGRYQEAAAEYSKSISDLEVLVKQNPALDGLRQSLAYAHNWLGETAREALNSGNSSDSYGPTDAEKEYSDAILLQEELHNREPANKIYQQELARTYYNRGIIRFRGKETPGVQSDFQKAIDLLEPLKSPSQEDTSNSNPEPAQDLARVYNNYANVISTMGKTKEAQAYYERAVALARQLVAKRPENREVKMELAQYYSNEARMLANSDESGLAITRSRQALEVFENLAQPTPTLSLGLASSLQLAGQLILAEDPLTSRELTNRALDLLKKNDKSDGNSALYMNVAANYLELAEDELKHGNKANARTVLANVTWILPRLSAADKQTINGTYQSLQGKLRNGPVGH